MLTFGPMKQKSLFVALGLGSHSLMTLGLLFMTCIKIKFKSHDTLCLKISAESHFEKFHHKKYKILSIPSTAQKMMLLFLLVKFNSEDEIMALKRQI